jgi:pSer/pThr/pTyr-binding forkhead associated (FHA) protein
MKAELIPIEGGEPIPITKDVTVLGRREYCDVQVDHPSLSKRHCVLVKTDGLLVIRDLATTNGTKVKGQKIRWAALLPEDRITLGSIKFRVYLGPDNVDSPSELAAKGIKPGEGRRGFPSPTPYPGVASPAKGPKAAPAAKSASKPKPNPKPAAAAPALDDDDLPLILDEAAWRDALGPDKSDEEEIIDLD